MRLKDVRGVLIFGYAVPIVDIVEVLLINCRCGRHQKSTTLTTSGISSSPQLQTSTTRCHYSMLCALSAVQRSTTGCSCSKALGQIRGRASIR
jgi:hypothetical protein